MLLASLAFAWVLWRQHRNGLIMTLGWLLSAGAASAVLPAYCAPETILGILGFFVSLTAGGAAMMVVGVFTYATEGAEILTRESCFPPRLFRLPVTTGSLVRWPMLFGAAAAMLLWLTVGGLILQPWIAHLGGSKVPLWWPGVLAAAVLALFQALLWSPFGLVGFRLVLLFFMIPCLFTLSALGAHSGIPEGWLVALYGSLTVIAWTIAYVGVRHGRRGDVPNWEAILWPWRQFVALLPQRRQLFRSAANAQLWFEWRLGGYSLPIMTAMVQPIIFVPLYLGKNDIVPTAQTLITALGAPILMAGIAGWPGASRNRWVKDRTSMSPFLATLPMSSADLVGAMLKAAVWSTLIAWAVVAVLTPLAVVVTGNLDEVVGWWHAALHVCSGFDLAVGIVAIAMLLLVWTWKRKVDCLHVGLAGRTWVELAMAGAYMPGTLVPWALAAWIYKHPETHETTLAALPWLLPALIACRLSAAAWAIRLSLRQVLLQPRTVACWAAGWLLLACTLFVMLAWAVPADLVLVYYLAYAVLYAMPMARLSATPLALAWNRHR